MGKRVGPSDGDEVGAVEMVGAIEGDWEGAPEGATVVVGKLLGAAEVDGVIEGKVEGTWVGSTEVVGKLVDATVGETVGVAVVPPLVKWALQLREP